MPEEQTPIRRGLPHREPTNGAGSAHFPRRETADLPADEYDALTDLFLGGDMAEASPQAPVLPTSGLAASLRSRVFDIVVNVSGGSAEAGLLFATYRRGEARQPVAVCRAAGSTSVIAVLADDELNIRPCGTLADAVGALAPIVTHWVIEVDEVGSLDATILQHASRVTIATTADEASVVAAYRAIKNLAGAVSARQELALMVLDRRLDSAARAADKIVRCADAFLGRRLSLVPISTQPLRGVTTMYTGPGVGPAEFLRLFETGGSPRVATPATPPARERRPGVPGRDATPVSGSDRDEAIGVPTPSSLAVTVGGDMTTLSVRCPHAEGVEFAVDARGGLHLLALAAKDGEAAEARAIAQLVTASAWSRAHLGLIAAAEPSVHLSRTAAKPMLHLITDQISQVRHLLDADIRVHLLAPVKSRAGVNWACADLN